MEEDIYFEVSVSLTPGQKRTREIGPYTEEDLNDYGEPPSEDVEIAVWNLIEEGVGVKRLS